MLTATRRASGAAGSPSSPRGGLVQPDPAGRVGAPAIGLIVTGALSVVFTVFGLLFIALGGASAINDPQARDALPGFGVMLGASVVQLVLGGLIIYAGVQMRKVQSWGLAVAGSIVAMLPCLPCCLLGLPIGIWALIVLFDSDVKRAFNGQGGYGGPGGYGGGYSPQGGGYGPPQG